LIIGNRVGRVKVTPSEVVAVLKMLSLNIVIGAFPPRPQQDAQEEIGNPNRKMPPYVRESVRIAPWSMAAPTAPFKEK
jgi:hypothetical protein